MALLPTVDTTADKNVDQCSQEILDEEDAATAIHLAQLYGTGLPPTPALESSIHRKKQLGGQHFGLSAKLMNIKCIVEELLCYRNHSASLSSSHQSHRDSEHDKNLHQQEEQEWSHIMILNRILNAYIDEVEHQTGIVLQIDPVDRQQLRTFMNACGFGEAVQESRLDMHDETTMTR